MVGRKFCYKVNAQYFPKQGIYLFGLKGDKHLFFTNNSCNFRCDVNIIAYSFYELWYVWLLWGLKFCIIIIMPSVSKKSDEFILQLVGRKHNPDKWNAHEGNRNFIEIFITPNSFSCNIDIVISRRRNKSCAILLLRKDGHFDPTGIPYLFMIQKIASWNITLNIVCNLLAQENVYYKYRDISVRNTTKGPQRTSLAWELRFSGAPNSRCADSVKKRVAATLRRTEYIPRI